MQIVITLAGIAAILFGSFFALAGLGIVVLGYPFGFGTFAVGSAIAGGGLYAIRRYG